VRRNKVRWQGAAPAATVVLWHCREQGARCNVLNCNEPRPSWGAQVQPKPCHSNSNERNCIPARPYFFMISVAYYCALEGNTCAPWVLLCCGATMGAAEFNALSPA
jgi:hypothetical protein